MLVFDIETIPNVDVTDPRIIAAAEKRGDTPEKFASICPALCRVVCIGADWIDGDRDIFFDSSLIASSDFSGGSDANEANMLSTFAEALDSTRQLVTFAGRSFDIPVLIHRYRAHKLPIPKILTAAMQQKPWESAPHTDMLNVLTCGGATSRYSLETYTIGAGIANPKDVGSGDGVLAMVREGKHDQLLRYCLADVAATAALWERWQ